MTKIYISDYPKIAGVKRFYYAEKKKFLFDSEDTNTVLFFVKIYHENSLGEVIENLTTIGELIASNNEQVYSLTGEYLEYDNSTMPPTLLHPEKGEPIGEFDFFEFLLTQPTIVDDLINNAIARGDSLGYFNKYVK